MAFDGPKSARRRRSAAQPRAFVAIAEDDGELFTVWETCWRNDVAGATCPHALVCECERHPSGPTLRAEVRSYDTMAAAIECAEVLNEPLLFGADGRRMPPQPRDNPPVAVWPKGDGAIDESDVPF